MFEFFFRSQVQSTEERRSVGKNGKLDKCLCEIRKSTILIAIVFIVVFIIHTSSLYSTYVSYPKSTKISEVDFTNEVIVTICPSFPYSARGLLDHGFSMNNESCRYFEYDHPPTLTCDLDDLIQDWKRDNFRHSYGDNSMKKLYLNMRVSEEQIFSNLSNISAWQPSMTTFGMCYVQEHKKRKTLESTIIDINSQRESYDCTTMLQHDKCYYVTRPSTMENIYMKITMKSNGRPVFLNKKDYLSWTFTPRDLCNLKGECPFAIVLSARYRHSISTPDAPCNSSAYYSRKSCLRDCLMETLTDTHGCVPHFHDVDKESKPDCTLTDSLAIASVNKDYRIPSHCSTRCPKQCDQAYLTATTLYDPNAEQVRIFAEEKISFIFISFISKIE